MPCMVQSHLTCLSFTYKEMVASHAGSEGYLGSDDAESPDMVMAKGPNLWKGAFHRLVRNIFLSLPAYM